MVSRKPRKESYPMLLWLSAAGALAGSLEFGTFQLCVAYLHTPARLDLHL